MVGLNAVHGRLAVRRCSSSDPPARRARPMPAAASAAAGSPDRTFGNVPLSEQDSSPDRTFGNVPLSQQRPKAD